MKNPNYNQRRRRKIFRQRTSKRERIEKRRKDLKAQKAKRFQAAMERRYWARFLAYVGRHKGTMAGIVTLLFFGGAIETVLPRMAGFVMDRIVPARDMVLLNGVIAAGLVLYFVHAALRYRERRLVVGFAMDLMTEIRSDLFAYHLRLPLGFFEKSNSGKLISKLTYSVYMIKLFIETVAYTCLREVILVALIVIAALFIDWKMTLVFVGLAPLFAFYLHRLNKYMAEVAGILQTKNDRILTILDRAFSSIKLLHIFGHGPKEARKFREVLEEDKVHRVRRTMVYAVNAILLSLITSCVTLAALWYGGRRMISGVLTGGELTAYVLYLTMLLRPISEFVRASSYLQAGKVGVYSVFSVFEKAEPMPEPEHPVIPKKREGRIEFKEVWFRYGRQPGGLKNASFRVEPGQKVLIVGPSGSGKSTLFNLLLRLYDCERGTVLLDGVSVRRLKREDVRSYFTMVTQDQLHVEDTVLSNVLLGSEMEKGDAGLELTLDLAGRLDMMRLMAARERKFGQTVAAGGMGFSRGELQKIAMMRAAAKEAPIVLLDEPTASLDERSSRKVLKFAEEAFAGRTVLMISHRPPEGFQADWVIVLKNGWMEAQGTHGYLLQHSRFYRQLCRRPEPVEKIPVGI